MIVKYHPNPSLEIQKVFDDPVREELADRLEQLLEEFEADPKQPRFNRHIFQNGSRLVKLYGSKQDFGFIWEIRHDTVWITWAGDPSPLRT